MANVPTLGEINAYQPNPDLGGGSPAVIIDNRETIRLLNEAANQKAKYDWNKYLVFQDNLKDVYKNIGDISALETATSDKEYLSKQAADIYQEIGQNPKDFFSGGGKYNDIQQKISKLRSEATESKLNQVYDFAHRQYINQNPELNTPENQQAINGYLSQPLGQRKAYSLNLPVTFDVGAYAKDVLDNPAVKTVEGENPSYVGADGLAGNDFIKQGGETTTYKHDAFMNRWMAGLETYRDKYGHGGFAQQEYNKLTPEQKKQYDNPEANGGYTGSAAYFHHLGEMTFGSKEDITTQTKPSEFAANQFAKEKLLQADKKEKFDEWAERQRIAIGWKNADKEDKENIDGATSIIRLGVNILNDAVKPENAVKVFDRTTQKSKTVYNIANPSLLKQFGTIDKDGKITHIPDKIRFDPESKQMLLTYKGIGSNKDIEEKPMTLSEWTLQLAKATYGDNQKAGDIYRQTDKELQNSGGDIYDLSKNINKSSGNKKEKYPLPKGKSATGHINGKAVHWDSEAGGYVED